MKKILLAVLLFAMGGGVYAQSPSADYIARHGQEIEQAKTNKLTNAVEKQASLSSLKIGKYAFALCRHEIFKAYGEAAHTYIYCPENRPVMFRQTVSIDWKTGERILASSAETKRLVGPIHWQYENYEISAIKVTIYPGEHLEFVQNQSKDIAKNPSWVFTTRDGKTVVVNPVASAKHFGMYDRQARQDNTLGQFSVKFTETVKRLQRNLNR